MSGLHITTWNVNGIRNPFSYPPWRDRRTFEAMFDLLEADIICFQETKIQRKDLRDDMVLVPGFDCYWSLPRHKKGYSGVVIYTRNAKCSPIRAEEGITGVLCPPNSATSFRDGPEQDQIGGYPTVTQLAESEIDAATLDAEGRCVVLEFPAFVLLGTYCPAERDETRTHFRTAFLKVLDSRIRNLVRMGKRVIWTGDLNISRQEIDTAMSEETMRKNGVDHVGWISTPARRLFNQMLVGGIVHGERDEGRKDAVMWDVCRGFHDGRPGMYTCWETKVNARPGNFGARIDYVVCSYDMKDWWADSNIQEGLLGSDHCPVYAVFKDTVTIQGQQKHIFDLANPPGMFVDGVRKQEWSTKNLLPMSGKLIPEFDKRRNIKDMFTRKTSIPKSLLDAPTESLDRIDQTLAPTPSKDEAFQASTLPNTITKPNNLKRTASNLSASAPKKTKQDTNGVDKGQKSLKGFFAAKPTASSSTTRTPSPETTPAKSQPTPQSPPAKTLPDEATAESPARSFPDEAASHATRKSWNKLFARPIAPKCEHNEPCKTMLTKKPGINCGRSFWMCNRPLGPSGHKEKGTEWRCSTFIWCSDWDARTEAG